MAGMDLAFSPDGKRSVAAVILWDVESQKVVEERLAVRAVRFPYVPGLLSFRETPTILAALRKLQQTPDALVCDGHGFAHPRRFGLACHVGLLVGLPTVGCAKSRLVGHHEDPLARRGATSALFHDDERIGSVLRTRDGVKPVYVSIGHRIDLRSAVRLVLQCGAGYRLPEPTRLADRRVAEAKRTL